MENYTREKRRLIFSKKIITPETIRNISRIIAREVDLIASKENERPLIVYSVDSVDNSSYESQTASIFNEGDILDRKIISRINIRLNTKDNSRSIEVQFKHIDDLENNTENYILISGDDPTWVNGLLAQFNEILSLTENQANYKSSVEFLVFITLLTLNIFYYRLFYSEIDKIKSQVLETIFLLGPPILWLLYAQTKLSNILKALWPDIELRTGPNHLQKGRQNKTKLAWIVSSLIVPIVLGAIYDFIKSYL